LARPRRAIIASGPSAKQAGVGALKGRLPVLAIKKCVELAPFADVVYGCDGPWWRHERGLPKFSGLKLCYDVQACDEFGLRRVHIPDKQSNRLRSARPAPSAPPAIPASRRSTSRRSSAPPDPAGRLRCPWPRRRTLVRPQQLEFRRQPDRRQLPPLARRFRGAADDLAARGIEVINASPLSDLKAFPKMTRRRRAGKRGSCEALHRSTSAGTRARRRPLPWRARRCAGT
jgi:hypothetical protein